MMLFVPYSSPNQQSRKRSIHDEVNVASVLTNLAKRRDTDDGRKCLPDILPSFDFNPPRAQKKPFDSGCRVPDAVSVSHAVFVLYCYTAKDDSRELS